MSLEGQPAPTAFVSGEESGGSCSLPPVPCPHDVIHLPSLCVNSHRIGEADRPPPPSLSSRDQQGLGVRCDDLQKTRGSRPLPPVHQSPGR